MSKLVRLTPDPIPAIHPVPEYAATGDLAEVYERTKEGLRVPWMGVVAMAYDHYPRFYETGIVRRAGRLRPSTVLASFTRCPETRSAISRHRLKSFSLR